EVILAIRAYRSSLEEHLEREERALVGPWLNLSQEQYKTFRGYLSPAFRMVY
ncbi:unnamed protein product, partial [Discosporangium mesarthrocarpum]